MKKASLITAKSRSKSYKSNFDLFSDKISEIFDTIHFGYLTNVMDLTNLWGPTTGTWSSSPVVSPHPPPHLQQGPHYRHCTYTLMAPFQIPL